MSFRSLSCLFSDWRGYFSFTSVVLSLTRLFTCLFSHLVARLSSRSVAHSLGPISRSVFGRLFKLTPFIYLFISLYRNDQDTEAMSKAHALEDLHGRLKTNVETIQQLNQQVGTKLNARNLPLFVSCRSLDLTYFPVICTANLFLALQC